jgi:hypothetical protein
MYSMKGDTVLDPFLGTGTTTLAAITATRNSIGVEIDEKLSGAINDLLTHGVVERSNERIQRRLSNHVAFVAERERTHGSECFKYRNKNYDFPVMTRQEVEIKVEYLKGVKREHDDTIVAEYEDNACLNYAEMHSLFAPAGVSTK